MLVVRQRIALRRHIDSDRRDGFADGNGLRGGGGLAGFLGHRLLDHPEQGFAGDPVENVDVPVLVDLRHRLAHDPFNLQIEQDHGIRRVEVPQIVADLLEVPAVLARGHVHSDDGDREKVVSGPHSAVEIRARIAGGEVQQAQFRIERGRLPHRGAAELPDLVVRGPRIVADLAGPGDRVERPDQGPVVRVIGLHASADTVFRTREPGNHQAVIIERRACDRQAVLPALGLDGPDNVAAVPVQRHQLAVELADENLALTEPDPPAGPAAADSGNIGVEQGFVAPQNFAGVDADGEGIVGTGDDVEHTFVNDGLGFTGILGADARASKPGPPHTLEPRDVVTVDPGQR